MLLLIISFLLPLAHAAAPVLELAPLIKEGTPGDLLMQDAVVPPQDGVAYPISGSGTLQQSLGDQFALPVISTAVPGNTVQFRGLGRSAEDTDVQAFGIPLNPPQGGGFDLSIFPQFLWASYQFQAGPALGTFDPRGTAGSLTLLPWTEQALAHPGTTQGRVIGAASTADLFQVSAAASDGYSVAVVAGTSAGDAQGPSAGLSARVGLSPGERLSFHLLATDLDARTPGPSGATPFAQQLTVRAIPLLQLDSRLAGGALLKSSVFADDEYLKYTDPGASALPATQDHILQVGTEHALLAGDWKFGAGLRGVQYGTLGFPDQSEAIAELLVSKALEPARGLLIEPTVRGVGVSRYGLRPEASLGARLEVGSGLAVHARGGLAQHFPSMLNRFYSYPGFPGYPGFAGNPALEPEQDWTVTLGAEWSRRAFKASFEAYAQLASNAQVRAPLDSQTDTEINSGAARIGSLLANVQWETCPWAALGGSATLSASELSQTGLAFPGLPAALVVAWLAVRAPEELAGGAHRWEARINERLSTDSVADASGNRLPAYHEEDLELRARVSQAWLVTARVEDLTDQRPVLVAGYPGLGRTAVGGVVYAF